MSDNIYDLSYGLHDDPSTITTGQVMEWLSTMSDSNRLSFFDALRAYYCLECGTPDPRCQCANDE